MSEACRSFDRGTFNIYTVGKGGFMETCSSCRKGHMVGMVLERYHYVESGLSRIYLTNLDAQKCDSCGDFSHIYQALNKLHYKIGEAICLQPFLFSGADARTLRRLVGFSLEEWAMCLGQSQTNYMFYEELLEPVKQSPHPEQYYDQRLDRAVRLLYAYAAAEQGFPVCDLIHRVLMTEEIKVGTCKIIVDAQTKEYCYE